MKMDVGVFAEDDPSPARVQIISGLTGDIVARILKHPRDIYRITPEQFEELVMDRVSAMRYEVKQVGKTNRPDGGIDIVFSSRRGDSLPVLGAIQVKHHSRPSLKSGVEVVHAMAGVLERHKGQFNLGMVVTNTSFTNEAQWFVEPFRLFLRLRDGADVQRWIAGDFGSPRERREFPTSIAFTSGLILDLKSDKH